MTFSQESTHHLVSVHNITPLPALYGEMGWLKTKYRHYIHVIRFWNRLVDMENNRLTKHIFQSDALFSVTGKRNWSYDVNSIIQHLRLPENVFENFVACDILNVKHKTFLLMEEEWKRDISKKPKLRKYITLKENFAIPNYASTLLPEPHRSIFAQFCCGILLLRVETGRRQKVRDETTGQTRSLKPEERVCSICSSGKVEGEYHFLLKCDVFSDTLS